MKMFPFRVYVRKGNKLCDMSVLEPGEYSVISIINGVKKEFLAEVPLLGYTPNTNPQETVIQSHTNPQTTCSAPKNPTVEKVTIPEVEDDSDDVDSFDVESDFEYQPSVPVNDSDVSLVHSDSEGQVMGGIPGRCDPDGDKFCWDNSSNEEDSPTRMTRYCIRN
ncbi:hypothetical protein Ddye_020490 [Dipteronia dyeriana]|uniref:Uncharacterized protein n=1 Tax=Dipteronia dyeriana TaxID=168575 RepID=A0AAD9U0W0_9ROSI|nr:hypothetical protein Ddye_020490 [Dipteronia dyeriana]